MVLNYGDKAWCSSLRQCVARLCRAKEWYCALWQGVVMRCGGMKQSCAVEARRSASLWEHDLVFCCRERCCALPWGQDVVLRCGGQNVVFSCMDKTWCDAMMGTRRGAALWGKDVVLSCGDKACAVGKDVMLRCGRKTWCCAVGGKAWCCAAAARRCATLRGKGVVLRGGRQGVVLRCRGKK